MKFILIIAVAILIAQALCEVSTVAVEDCTTHPFRKFKVLHYEVPTSGIHIGCFTKPDQYKCFKKITDSMDDFFIDDKTPIAVGSNPVCSNLKNTCIKEDSMADFTTFFSDYIDQFVKTIKNVLTYDKQNDELEIWVTALATKIIDWLKSQLEGTSLYSLVSNYLKPSLITDHMDEINDAIESAFEYLSSIVDKLLVAATPFFEGVNTYSAGIACGIAEVDFVAGAVNLDNQTFNIRGTLFEFMQSKLDEENGGGFITGLNEKLHNMYADLLEGVVKIFEKIGVSGFTTTSLNNALEGAGVDIDGKIDTYVTYAAVLEPITTEVENCLFPTTNSKDYCVPFLDEIVWAIEGVKILISGDFSGAMTYFKNFPDAYNDADERAAIGDAEDNTVTESLSVINTTSWIMTATENETGFDVIAAAENSNVKTFTAEDDDSSDDDKEDDTEGEGALPFTDEQLKIAGIAAGGLFILTIACCVIYKKSQNKKAAAMYGYGAPPAMAGPPASFGPGARGRGPASFRGRRF